MQWRQFGHDKGMGGTVTMPMTTSMTNIDRQPSNNATTNNDDIDDEL